MGVQLQITNRCPPHHVQMSAVVERALSVTSGVRETGWPVAKHGQAAAKIKKSNTEGTEVSGRHMNRKEAKGVATGTEAKKEKQE